MPLARFSDPVKVTVSLCSKTLWDERIPNWVETLVCNCLIPFCLIQEKERERERRRGSDGERGRLICEYRRWDWVTWGWIFRMIQSDAAIGLILLCFFSVSPQMGWECEGWGGLLLSRRSSPLCSLWSRCPRSIRHRSGDCLRKQNLPPKRSLSLNHRHCMKICTLLFRHGKGQPSTIPFAFFNSQRTSKDDTGKNAAVLPRTSQWSHFFLLL